MDHTVKPIAGKLRVIFFDVGNTLLFPNRDKILAALAENRRPTLEQWRDLERKTKNGFDREMRTRRIDHSFWWTFHSHLMEELKEPEANRDALVRQLVRSTQISANWDHALPGTRAALERIAAKFRIAAISNADGGIADILARCDLADCFETITDSGIVGIEKPDARIFAAALAATNAQAEESLYVGDVYSVDYLGASNARMQAVLFDVAGAYCDRPEPRVESLEELERWLE